MSLARGIVVAQGNDFVKELLRHKGVRIGATKADFEHNMVEAIKAGLLTETDFAQWLDEVEGWGDQHIYLYNVPPAVARNAAWNSPDSVGEMVRAAGLGKVWNARTSHVFPKKMTLTSISFVDGELRITWHRAAGSWVRVPSRDEHRTIDGDDYEFRAYRYRGKRAVMRLTARGKSRRFGNRGSSDGVAVGNN